MSERTSSVCVVGLGLMGRPIARRLLAAGFDACGWNRSPLLPELTEGIPLCPSLEKAAETEVALLVLADSSAVDAVLAQLEPHLARGRLVVDMGTSDPARSREHARRLGARGVGWVDAPVSGGPEGVEEQRLAIMAGGSEQHVARAEPLLRALGSVVRVGAAGDGHSAKLVNQVIVGLTIEAVAEALALAEQAGLDLRLVQQALRGGSADSRILQAHGTRMIERDFAPRATVRTMLKDARLGLALAGSASPGLPHLAGLAHSWEQLAADGQGEADCSILFTLRSTRQGGEEMAVEARDVARASTTGNSGWSFELIDLSRPLTVETVDALFGDLVSEGKNQYFRDISIEVVVDYSTTNACSCMLRIPDHAATHLDAPVHIVEGGARLEDVDLRRLIGEAVVLDLDRGGADYGYTAEDFAQATPEVRPGDIVLVYSGFRDAKPGERMRQTYLTPGAAEWLVARGAHAVGLEPASPDPVYAGLYEHGWADKPTPNPPPWPAHQVLLRNGVYIIEGLVNLDRIKGQRVRFAALPPLIPGLSGCPVRAVAWLERSAPSTPSV